MDAEDFFSRWSRRKAQTQQQPDDTRAVDASGHTVPDEARALPPPTLDDVAALTPQSDFSRFVARGVDENVRRSALKKLFADPHFNVMDGLDTYIDDYNKFTPIPAAVLAALNHAQDLLNPQPPRTQQPECAAEESTGANVPAAADHGPDENDGSSDDGSSALLANSPDRPDHGDPIQDM